MAAKIKQEYDEDGRWVQERNRIKGAIRRAFRLSPQMKDVLNAARVELPPKLKKDGTPGKKNQVKYKCAGCGELFSQTFKKSRAVQVDHIEPVVPLWKREVDMTYDEIVRGVFCNLDNLQVMCSIPMSKNDGKRSCHQLKTDEENWVRRQIDADRKVGDPGTIEDGDVIYKNVDHLVEVFKEKYKEHLIEKEAKENAKRERKKSKKR